MRWDEQRVENEDGRLPGIGSGTVVRTFDAPEAMGINFHEVRAKSVLNHVPGGRYGFNWTINPFRGCTHACVYCASPETEVLRADGRTVPIAHLRAGEHICGTDGSGRRRRLVDTRVLDHWRTTKPAYRVHMEGGGKLVTSADHLLLTEAGWLHVADSPGLPRPHLRPGSRLMARTGGLDLDPTERSAVAAVEELGYELELFDITTGTGDFIANGVVSHNCFARRTHTYLDFDAGRDFEREIVVKVNTPEVLRAQLARSSWKRELVALGTNTDPYQWAESRYRFMPEIIEALRAARTPISVLTKSPLVLRDIDLYAEMAKEVGVSVNLSIPTLDEKAWRATEPHTPSPRARLEAVAKLKERGIGSGVLIAPLMPGINDSPEQVEPLVQMAREAGADFLGGVALHLRDEVREVFMGWLAAKRPDLLPAYERLYANGRAYLRPADRKAATRAVRGWGSGRAGRARRDGGDRAERRAAPGADRPTPRRQQRSLF
jgi:DNA repair photolyase